MAYGLQIFDQFGNIILDTSDNTVRNLNIFSVSGVTANGTFTGLPITSSSIPLVTNNLGVSASPAYPFVELDTLNGAVRLVDGRSGFNANIMILDF